ncbi:UNVERIFIED_CONTAM: hypothetical protein GTU68_047729 [Idotea baltica]|nr:hypothetical protein [Idotea baltica]
MDDYVKTVDQFKFLPGAIESISRFQEMFKYIIVVTNQQGIGKELMTHEDLAKIHGHMSKKLNEVGATVDEVLYCPHLAILNPSCRKPNPGMAFQAKEIFKDISFKKSVMVGDTESDIEFGKRLNMYTVLISPDRSVNKVDKEEYFGADLVVSSLLEMSEYFINY